MRSISYDVFVDKVRGCFAGKAAIGTMGAPYEGVKMRMELSYRREMTDAMLSNDDLDLQILWLDVVRRYGADFTSAQLLDRFCACCDYSPGEYAVMRKNHDCGIYPPYSGEYRNDFYKQGMGCPIRSEIWACLAPGDPELAADYASRDGVLDHSGESVYAERFFAAAEAEAFFEDDIEKLIETGLSVIPEDCKFRRLVNDTVKWCREYGDAETVRAFILDGYGHPDCTNLFQNMGITLACLLLCGRDPIKTGLTALNCGFDTDCTCASAGAMLGILLGGRKFSELTGMADLRYVLSVRADPRSDKTDDLADEIALLAASMPHKNAVIDGAPEAGRAFEAPPEYSLSYEYAGLPCASPGKPCRADIVVRHAGPIRGTLYIEYPEPLCGEEKKEIAGEGTARATVTVAVADGTEVFPQKNIIKVRFETDCGAVTGEFGVCCADVWRVDGPFWRTEPAILPDQLEGGKSYWAFMKPGKNEGESTDNVRDFHLDFARDTETPYVSPDELFEPFEPGYSGGRIKRYFYREQDSFRLSDISDFYGPCTFYLSQKLICGEDRTVYIQLGRTAPFELYLNGELLSRRDDCDTFTSENVHISGVKLKKGENRLVLRLTQINGDSKWSLVFSKGATCAEHYTDLKSRKI